MPERPHPSGSTSADCIATWAPGDLPMVFAAAGAAQVCEWGLPSKEYLCDERILPSNMSADVTGSDCWYSRHSPEGLGFC